MNSPLVSVAWLNEHLRMPNLVVLNATLAKVSSTAQVIDLQIQGARNFDIKHTFSDTTSHLPNTVPTSSQFENEAAKLGISTDSVIVVYDEHGIYSSPRAWWLFRTFGHQQVAVLDGGLPAWLEAGFQTEKKQTYTGPKGNFKANLVSTYMRQYQEVLAAIDDPNKLILDARSEARFGGHAPEPREGLRSGHIPSSVNRPYTELLDSVIMKSSEDLKNIFSDNHQGELIMSCGSGITACILALGAELAGHQKISVYDGSWTEWGSKEELPIEKSAN